MASVRPRHVVCALGTWRSFDDLEKLVREVSGEGFELDDEYSMLAPDPRMKLAFEVSRDRVAPSFEASDERAVAEHRAVAYFLSPPMESKAAKDTSARMLSLVGALFERGGATAVKGESSGIAHGRERWVSLARKAKKKDRLARAAALSEAWVRRPLEDEDRGVYYSCGMHLLGERDVELPTEDAPEDAVLWIDALGIYLLAEKPADDLRPGETFRPTKEHEKRVLAATDCDRYEEDDFFFNPYGYWRLDRPRPPW